MLTAAATFAGYAMSASAQTAGDKVIAHVGSVNVTQQEVDDELNRANVAADKRTDQVLKEALTRVIARKYFAQRALDAKLDRDPAVSRELARLRDLALAEAYAQHEISKEAASISAADIDGYIRAHPTQFQDHQLFQADLVSPAPQKDMDAIASATKDFKSLDQVETKLNELGIKFTRSVVTLDSGTIEPELLKRLKERTPSDLFLIRSGTGMSYLKVSSVDAKPLTGEEANKFAIQQLRVDLTKKIAQQSVEAALSNAKFEGDYGRIMATPAPAADHPTPNVAGEKPAEKK